MQLVRYRPSATVSIERGENAGRQITYRNIVTDWQSLVSWDSSAPLSVQAKVTGTEPVVVIVQQPGPGAIVAAAEMN